MADSDFDEWVRAVRAVKSAAGFCERCDSDYSPPSEDWAVWIDLCQPCVAEIVLEVFDDDVSRN